MAQHDVRPQLATQDVMAAATSSAQPTQMMKADARMPLYAFIISVYSFLYSAGTELRLDS